jgi:DNA-binding NarL/FixJ family response regulator
MNTFRILVADNHPIFRLGLRSLLNSHEGWRVCGEAADGRDAVEKCRELKPDLLILDISMPRLNGVDAARQILKGNPAQRILVFTDVNSEQVVRDCLKAGVQGWVFKSDGNEDLTAAVKLLQQHKPGFTGRVSDLIMDGYLRHYATPATPKVYSLSLREREVLQLISEGATNKEISAKLHVSLKTAETHRSNIMRKLKLHRVAELVLYAVRNEIVHVETPPVLPVSNRRPGENSHLKAS